MYNVRKINNKFDKIDPYLNLWEYSIDPKDLTIQQKFKQAFFKVQTSERFNHYSRSTHKSTFKKSGDILDNLLNLREFSKIKTYISLTKVLSTILTPNLLKMVCFAYYRERKLTIQVLHPVGQYELNHRKQDIISICKKIPDFQDIAEVSIFRQDKLNKFSKEFNRDYFNTHSPYLKQRKESEYRMNKMNFFEERSVGIFENKCTNEKQKNKFETIRKFINKNRDRDKLRDEK